MAFLLSWRPSIIEKELAGSTFGKNTLTTMQNKWTAAASKDMQTNLEQKEDQHLLVVFVVQAVGSGQSKSVANLRRE